MAKLVLICFIIFCLTIVSWGKTCSKVLEKGVKVSDEIRQQILDKHNELRSLIVSGSLEGWPQGTNLNVIGWNVKLAEEAQRRAELFCHREFFEPPVHDCFDSVGELEIGEEGITPNNEADFEAAIQAWFDQHKNHTYPNFPSGFAQIVKSDTQYVGCGYAYYKVIDKPDIKKYIYLCLYGPGISFPYHDASPTYTPLDKSDKNVAC